MRTISRLACTAAAIGTALFFSGCSTMDHPVARVNRASHPAKYYDMQVVANSGGRVLSPSEMIQLRDDVIAFAQTKGVLKDGAYYVQVKFKPLNPGEEGTTIVVKLTEQLVSDYDLLASSEDQSPYYYPGYGSAGYAYGSYGYSAFGNYDPFDPWDYGYDGGSYYRPVPVTPQHPHDRDHDHDHDRNHRPDDNDHHHDADDHHDVARHDGGDNHPPHRDNNPRPEPRHWESGNSSSGNTASYSPPSSSGGGSSYSPPPVSSPEPSSSRGSESPGRDNSPVAAK